MLQTSGWVLMPAGWSWLSEPMYLQVLANVSCPSSPASFIYLGKCFWAEQAEASHKEHIMAYILPHFYLKEMN